MNIKSAVHELEYQKTEVNFPAILGDSCTQMGLIKRLYSVDKEETADILGQCKDVFTGLRCVPGQHDIQIDPTVPAVTLPVKCQCI